MELELSREELETEIAEVEGELETKTAELDEVRKQLKEDDLGEVYAEEYDDEDYSEDDADNEDGDDDEGDKGNDGEGDSDEDEDLATDEELEAKHKKLTEEVIVLQMRLAALNRRLNNILAGEGMDNFTEREE